MSLSYLADFSRSSHGASGADGYFPPADQLLRQSGTIRQLTDADLLAGGAAIDAGTDQGFVTRAMDHNDLERERGITILSKCTSVNYNGHLIK